MESPSKICLIRIFNNKLSRHVIKVTVFLLLRGVPLILRTNPIASSQRVIVKIERSVAHAVRIILPRSVHKNHQQAHSPQTTLGFYNGFRYEEEATSQPFRSKNYFSLQLFVKLTRSRSAV